MLLRALSREEAKQAYYGTLLWSLLSCVVSGDNPLPQWQELFGRREPRKEETAEEIKARIVEKMRRG